MATVYLAMLRGPGGFHKLQVIKRLRPNLAEDPDFVQMFLDEARLAAKISHPNVVQTNEIGSEGDSHFIAMEFLEGQTLEAILRALRKRGGEPGLPLAMHLKILAQVLEGLHYAHELRDFDGTPLDVVHRDVSPQNVMVTYDGHVKVLDFGIAKAADSSQDTRAGVLKGKCAYMSPEQFGTARVDRRSDIFSVGILLWQALTGQRLWNGLTETEIFTRLAKGEIPPVTSVNANAPEALVQLCMKALASAKEERFNTAEELQTGIEDYMAQHSLRVSATQIGSFLAELFAERRAEVRRLIEDARKQGAVPSIDVAFDVSPPRAEATGTRSRIDKSRLAIAGGVVAVLLAGGIGLAVRSNGAQPAAVSSATAMSQPPAPAVIAEPSASPPIVPSAMTTTTASVEAPPLIHAPAPVRRVAPGPYKPHGTGPASVVQPAASVAAPPPASTTPAPAVTKPARPDLGY